MCTTITCGASVPVLLMFCQNNAINDWSSGLIPAVIVGARVRVQDLMW